MVWKNWPVLKQLQIHKLIDIFHSQEQNSLPISWRFWKGWWCFSQRGNFHTANSYSVELLCTYFITSKCLWCSWVPLQKARLRAQREALSEGDIRMALAPKTQHNPIRLHQIGTALSCIKCLFVIRKHVSHLSVSVWVFRLFIGKLFAKCNQSIHSSLCGTALSLPVILNNRSFPDRFEFQNCAPKVQFWPGVMEFCHL